MAADAVSINAKILAGFIKGASNAAKASVKIYGLTVMVRHNETRHFHRSRL
jgi:hypothetical protein